MVHSAEVGSIPVPDISALIARLESAEAGSRELDAKIALLCLPQFSGWIEHPANNGNQYGELAPSREAFDEWLIRDGDPCLIAAPDFTTSLDAALALAERVLAEPDIGERPGRLHDFAQHFNGRWEAKTYRVSDGSSHQSVAATPALALCISILRAIHYGYEAAGEVSPNLKAKAQGEGGHG